MYMNSMGLNGKEGNAAATGAFQAGPGYQWQVDQAQEGAARAANKIGGAYGGTAQDTAVRLSSNLANQEYGKWQTNLQGFQGAAQNAVSGQAGALNNLAGTYQNQAGTTSQLYANQGKDLGTINQNQGNAEADLYKGLGKDQASIWSDSAKGVSANEMATGQALSNVAANQGTNLATIDTGFGQSMANNYQNYANNMTTGVNNYYAGLIPAGQQGFQAGQTAAANKVGAGMGIANMAASAMGSGMGSGGLFTKMWGG
jgi:hypothetical protein